MREWAPESARPILASPRSSQPLHYLEILFRADTQSSQVRLDYVGREFAGGNDQWTIEVGAPVDAVTAFLSNENATDVLQERLELFVWNRP